MGPRKQVSVRDPGILREGAALWTEYTGTCKKSDIKPVQVSCSQLLQTDERCTQRETFKFTTHKTAAAAMRPVLLATVTVATCSPSDGDVVAYDTGLHT